MDGSIDAVAVVNNAICVGGTFDRVGPALGSMLGFDPSTAAPLQARASTKVLRLE